MLFLIQVLLLFFVALSALDVTKSDSLDPSTTTVGDTSNSEPNSTTDRSWRDEPTDYGNSRSKLYSIQIPLYTRPKGYDDLENPMNKYRWPIRDGLRMKDMDYSMEEEQGWRRRYESDRNYDRENPTPNSYDDRKEYDKYHGNVHPVNVQACWNPGMMDKDHRNSGSGVIPGWIGGDYGHRNKDSWYMTTASPKLPSYKQRVNYQDKYNLAKDISYNADNDHGYTGYHQTKNHEDDSIFPNRNTGYSPIGRNYMETYGHQSSNQQNYDSYRGSPMHSQQSYDTYGRGNPMYNQPNNYYPSGSAVPGQQNYNSYGGYSMHNQPHHDYNIGNLMHNQEHGHMHTQDQNQNSYNRDPHQKHRIVYYEYNLDDKEKHEQRGCRDYYKLNCRSYIKFNANTGNLGTNAVDQIEGLLPPSMSPLSYGIYEGQQPTSMYGVHAKPYGYSTGIQSIHAKSPSARISAHAASAANWIAV